MKVRDPKDKGKIRVLVYGTLKKGHVNHGLIGEDDSYFVGYDSITGPYDMVSLGAFPGVIDHAVIENKDTIHGELWAITPEGLAALDLLEGNPNFYQRRKVWTNVHKRRAWVYILNDNYRKQMENLDAVEKNLWRPSKDEETFWDAVNG